MTSLQVASHFFPFCRTFRYFPRVISRAAKVEIVTWILYILNLLGKSLDKTRIMRQLTKNNPWSSTNNYLPWYFLEPTLSFMPISGSILYYMYNCAKFHQYPLTRSCAYKTSHYLTKFNYLPWNSSNQGLLRWYRVITYQTSHITLLKKSMLMICPTLNILCKTTVRFLDRAACRSPLDSSTHWYTDCTLYLLYT